MSRSTALVRTPPSVPDAAVAAASCRRDSSESRESLPRRQVSHPLSFAEHWHLGRQDSIMLYALLLIQVATLIVVRTVDPPQQQHHHLFTYGRTFHFAQPQPRTRAQVVLPKYGNFSSTALALRYRALPLALPPPPSALPLPSLPLPSLPLEASSEARPYHFSFHLSPATSSIRRQLIVSSQPSVRYLPRLRSNPKAVLLKTTTAAVHRQPVIAVAASSTPRIIVSSSSSSSSLPYRNISSKQLYVPSQENDVIQRTAPDSKFAPFFAPLLSLTLSLSMSNFICRCSLSWLLFEGR